MHTENDSRPHNPKLLRNELFAACKWWIGLSLLTKILVFAVGALSVWYSLVPDVAPYAVGTLMILGELAMWKSDHLRGIAEALHRKLDHENSFGWQITQAEISDVLARTNCDLDRLSEDKETGSNFFASRREPGTERAAANLQESAWWSKHLAESMWLRCIALVVALIGISVVLLILSLNAVSNPLVMGKIGRIVTSVILLIFSLGLLRFTVGYFKFGKASESVEEAAKALASRVPVDQIAILKLWQEYQLARASAPILPTWIWRKHEKKLNELWANYRI
jgi:hypothetical protein